METSNLKAKKPKMETLSLTCLNKDVWVILCLFCANWHIWPLINKHFKAFYEEPDIWNELTKFYFPEKIKAEQTISLFSFKALWTSCLYDCHESLVMQQIANNEWIIKRFNMKFWRKKDQLDPVPQDRLRSLAKQQVLVRQLKQRESELDRSDRDARKAVNMLIEEYLSEEEEIHRDLKIYLKTYYDIQDINYIPNKKLLNIFTYKLI